MTASGDERGRVLALAAALRAADAGDNTAEDEDDGGWHFIDWTTAWTGAGESETWLVKPLIPTGRSVAIHAPGGTGKSLLSLYIAATLAAGRPLFGVTRPPVRVFYLDYEMIQKDIIERLAEMGYGPDNNPQFIDNFHYAIIPDLDPLDTDSGGQKLLTQLQHNNTELLVIDTLARAVAGDENEADTIRDFYRHTGSRIKHAGISMARMDHTGKDPDRGARGTSAKRDDVDVVWRLTALDGGAMRLKAEKRRLSWVPEQVDILRVEDDDGIVSFQLADASASWAAGTAGLATQLDSLGLPGDSSVRETREAMKVAGIKAKNNVLRDAVKFRKESRGTERGTDISALMGHRQGTQGAHNTKPLVGEGARPGAHGAQGPQSTRGTVPPPRGARAQDHETPTPPTAEF